MQEKEKNQQLAVLDYLSKGNQFVFYIFRKISKVSSAIYIVTDLIKDNEPLKWSLRKTASEIITLRNFFDEKSVLNNTERLLLELESSLDFALGAKVVSMMNAVTIQNEIRKLISEMRESSKEGFYLPELSVAFFDVPKPSSLPILSEGLSLEESKSDYKSHKGHSVPYDFYNRTPKPSIQKTKPTEQRFSSDQKGQRKDEILKIIRNKKEVTIKDITEKIKDCSEKTIQRELITLVDEGLLKRTGERRWSKYSLKS